MQIAIIGCGNMGGALARRLGPANQLLLYDRHVEKTECLEREGNGRACQDMSEALEIAEIVILAVKPQNIKQTAGLIKDSLLENKLLVSLLAATKIGVLEQYFPASNIVRMMPNLPLIYGEGVIGLSSDEKTTKENKACLAKTFETLGKIYWLPEEKMDALTVLGGSGPAFFFAMVEAMIDAGIAMGFTAQEAQGVAHQMFAAA